MEITNKIIEFYKNHTARETCIQFGLPFTRQYVKALHRHYPKGLGWGGKRQNSGNKKGWNKGKKPLQPVTGAKKTV